MIHTPQRADAIPPVRHSEAMELTAAENSRLLTQLRGLTDAQWRAQTECTRWTVRDIVVHLIGSAKGRPAPSEFARQLPDGRRLTEATDGSTWSTASTRPSSAPAPSGRRPCCRTLWQRHSAARSGPGAGCPPRSVRYPSCRSGPGWACTSAGSRCATSSTSASPVTSGCTGSISPGPPASSPSSHPTTTAGSSPTSWPNGRAAWPALHAHDHGTRRWRVLRRRRRRTGQ